MMKIPNGMAFHGHGYHLEAGDDIPEELLERLPDDHPLKTAQAPKPRVLPDKGK